MRLYIAPDGNCTSIYDEALDLHSLGTARIERASHVEPTSEGHWTADLRPVGGPTLGPFTTRSQALQAELAWLELWLDNLHGELKA